MGNGNYWAPALAGLAQGFAQGMEKSYERKKMRMRLDAEMGIRGYERMEDNDVKEYVKSQKALAFQAEGGGATLPRGARAKNGIITDKSGNTIGNYAPGYEPKPMKKLEPSTGEIVNFGGNYYKFNPEMAKKMSYKYEPSADVIRGVTEKLNEEFKGKGSWNPSMAYVDGNAYRFTPGEQFITPQPKKQPDQNQSLSEMRTAIQNALTSGATMEEIIAGIREEGYDPQIFADLFQTKQQPQPRFQQAYTLTNMFGLPQQASKPERKMLKAA